MLVNKLIDYESGQLSVREILELFAELVKTGEAWTLQGHYGRTAEMLIAGGHISKDGEVLYVPEHY